MIENIKKQNWVKITRRYITNKAAISILSFFLVIALVLPSSAHINFSFQHTMGVTIHNTLENGWIEHRDNITILHLNGTAYDMGVQQGMLLKTEIQENVRACLAFCNEKGFPYQRLLEIWDVMKPLLPQPYIEEMQGIADGSDVSFENISIFNFGLYSALNCASFSAWGPATSDGRLYHARSSDFPLTVRDPLTGVYLQENQLVIIRKPIIGYASFAPSLAGEVDCESGMNEKGIAVGMLSSWTDNETYQGIEVGFRMRMVLDDAATAEEAIRIITSNRTLGYNFVLSDGKIPKGFELETNANRYYVGTWNTSSESMRPFWAMDHVVRRTNMFVDPTMAASQRKWYNPTLFPLLSMVLGMNPLGKTELSSAGPWVHYTALSKGIQQKWGALNLTNAMALLRAVYLGKTDVRFFLIQRAKAHTTIYQWVACPKTGDILLSFATIKKNAFENPVHAFNFFELLNESPPFFLLFTPIASSS
jgi:hypothetical protein